MSLKTYQQTQATAETPRQAEYRVIAKVTHGLIAARDRGVRDKAFNEALDTNRRMWSVLSTDARRCRAHRVSCVVVWAPAPARMVDPWLQLQSEALSAASGIESVLRYFRLPSDAVAALEAESQRLQAAVKGSLP